MKTIQPSEIHWGIQKKLILSVLVGGFFFLVVGLYLTYSYVENALTVAIGSNFEEIAKKTAEGFDATVQKEILPFEILASDPEFIRLVRDGNRSALVRSLKTYLSFEEEQGVHMALYVLDQRGQILGGPRFRRDEMQDQSGLPWWQAMIRKRALYASTLYADPGSNRYAFDFAVPIKDATGENLLGVIKGVLDTKIFFRFIKEMRFAKTGHGMLMSSDGTPLICSILPLVKHSMNEPLINRIIRGGTGWTQAEDDAHGGRHSMVGFAPVRFLNSLGTDSLGGLRWYAFIRQDPKETFAPVRSLLWKLLLFEAAVIGLVGVFGVVVVRRFILKPLGQLQDGIQHVAKGRLDHRVEIRTQDEIQFLAEGLNRMSQALQESYSGLEEKIRERTRDLRTSETKYRALMQEANDAIFLINPKTGDVIEANQQAVNMTEYSMAELMKLNIQDFQPDHEVEYAMDQFRKAVKRGHAVMHDAVLRKKDGEILRVDIRSRVIEYEGFRVYHCIYRDVSEQKKEEEKKRTAHEQLVRSTQVMLDQDHKIASLRNAISRIVQNSTLSDAEKEEALHILQDAS